MILKTSPDEIQNFLIDASNYKGSCDAVYFPENADEVSLILKEAYAKGTPVTISGNGTGLTGARVPEGGIVISTDKLNRIIEINPEQHTAIVEPGVILSEFLEAVKQKELLYPPDPTEKNCYIGGTVATNASGEKTFKYGPTRDYVLGLEVVLSDGEILQLNRGGNIASGNKLIFKTCSDKQISITLPYLNMPGVKNASGYYIKENMDAIDLFIGSEGTLGVITKIKLKLLPQPAKVISCLIFFNDEKDALHFIFKARRLSFQTRRNKSADAIDALALEFFDGDALAFLKDDYPQVPASAQAGVWFEQEALTDPDNEEPLLEQWMELIAEFNGDEESAWFAVSEADKAKIQGFRHAISAKVNEFISKYNMRKLGTDAAVPDDKFEEFYFSIKKLVRESGIDTVAYGHFGNSHVHLNILPKNNEEFLTGKKIYAEICNKAIEMKGTVSAEHGIGKIKTDYLLAMYGDDVISRMIEVKKVLDPEMILGRGNMFKFQITNKRQIKNPK
jgi:D-lactate dehydrogenase (cytochrome)